MFYNFSFKSSVSDPALPPHPPFHHEKCGISINAQTQQIVGGTLAPPDAWPWVVSLVGHNGFVCTGTIIERQWVMTAGHCYIGQRFDVMFGSHHLNTASYVTSVLGFTPDSTGEKIDKLRLSLPLAFKHHVLVKYPDHDIALLKLGTSFNYSQSVQPVCVAESNDWDNNSVCYLTGWGDGDTEEGTEALQQLRVQLMNQTLCRGIHASFGVRNTGGSLCAIVPDSTQTTPADSGATLVCLKNGRYYAVGVVSHSIQIFQDSYVNFFTRVAKHAHWIYYIVKNN
ncbi:chymotrypsinogen 2-like [Physella acuta]|uniref:chymotrypsinogen 2-like n=1 Tax=Physella acuta TaxID=109671 RepID=UPI0027DAFB84|nr:chymotrypsinogen 2-like [Physella acuta]